MKRGLSKDKSLKLYATTKKYGRRHDREPKFHTSPLVEYSKRNPDEEDTVLEAQWRIRETRQRESSLPKRILALLNGLLGTPWISSSPTPILEHIVLGGRKNAANREQLYGAGITHVCNCALQVANYFEGEFVYVKLHLHDSVNEELIPHFQTVASFLRRVESLCGRALIHCISDAFALLHVWKHTAAEKVEKRSSCGFGSVRRSLAVPGISGRIPDDWQAHAPHRRVQLRAAETQRHAAQPGISSATREIRGRACPQSKKCELPEKMRLRDSFVAVVCWVLVNVVWRVVGRPNARQRLEFLRMARIPEQRERVTHFHALVRARALSRMHCRETQMWESTPTTLQEHAKAQSMSRHHAEFRTAKSKVCRQVNTNVSSGTRHQGICAAFTNTNSFTARRLPL